MKTFLPNYNTLFSKTLQQETISNNLLDKSLTTSNVSNPANVAIATEIETGINIKNLDGTNGRIWAYQYQLLSSTAYHIHRELEVITTVNALDGYLSVRDGDNLGTTLINMGVGSDVNVTTPEHGRIIILIYSNFAAGLAETNHKNLQIEKGNAFTSYGGYNKLFCLN